MADGNLPALVQGMIGVRECRRQRVQEDSGRIGERDAMFLEIGRSLARVPLERHVRDSIASLVDAS